MATSLTTAAAIKDQLGINVTTWDSVLATIASGVNAAIENKLGVVFAETTYTNEEYDFDKPSRVMVLKHAPVISFTQLQYKDDPMDEDSDNWTTIDSGEYKVNLSSGKLVKNTPFERGVQRYRVTYSAGYSSVPDDVTLAADMLGAAIFQNRKSHGVQSETLGQYSRTFTANPTNWQKLGIEDLLVAYTGYGLDFFADGGWDERPRSSVLL